MNLVVEVIWQVSVSKWTFTRDYGTLSEKETVVEKTDGLGIKVYRGIYATLHSQSICLKSSLKVTVLAQSFELKSFFFFMIIC